MAVCATVMVMVMAAARLVTGAGYQRRQPRPGLPYAPAARRAGAA